MGHLNGHLEEEEEEEAEGDEGGGGRLINTHT